MFRDVFEVLTEVVPMTEYGDPSQQWTVSPQQAEDLRKMAEILEKLRVQRRVIGMLDRIVRGPRLTYRPLSVEETQWIQYEHRDGF